MIREGVCRRRHLHGDLEGQSNSSNDRLAEHFVWLGFPGSIPFHSHYPG